MADKMYIVYDGRALLNGTDSAMVLECGTSLREIRRSMRGGSPYGECHVYEYDMDRTKNPPEAINEKYVETFK